MRNFICGFAMVLTSPGVYASACGTFITCGEYEAVGAPERVLSIVDLGDQKVRFSTTSSDGNPNPVVFQFADDGSFEVSKVGTTTVGGLGHCLKQVCQINVRPILYEGQLLSQLLTLRFSPTGVELLKLNSMSDGQIKNLSAIYTKK